ncbi:uncharacterized protein LOC107607535 [Arachis ipaensis]|uniref:uncharacterized protein LOC107607535 n=1 Tax=Arachis ipaensis TaxID=130454 RepID=UPI000A2B3199|nr:uncharacterized protein LOC107607535 [Arachis ipaensis]
MRLLMSSLNQDEGEIKRFANWILDVGNENIGSVVGDELEIEISNDLLITTTDDPFSHLVDFAYPNLLQNMSDYSLQSQSQSLSHVGLYLSKSVFTHGQLYVALSRVKSRSGLRVLILDEDGNPKSSTTNIVFKEVFNNI